MKENLNEDKNADNAAQPISKLSELKKDEIEAEEDDFLLISPDQVETVDYIPVLCKNKMGISPLFSHTNISIKVISNIRMLCDQ